jgi:hypothetical protein
MFLLFAIAAPVAPARWIAMPLLILSLPILLFALGGNAFGIRRKQGRMYAGSFEMTQPCGTAQLAAIKLLVRTTCVLVALFVVGTSAWLSSSLLGSWGEWLPDGRNNAVPKFLEVRHTVREIFAGLTGYAQVALAAVASIVVAGMVASQAATEALKSRYPRGVFLFQWLPVVWGIAIILVALAVRSGMAPASLMQAVFKATFWISGAAMVLCTIYLLRDGFANRVMTMRYVGAAVAISVVFGAAVLAALSSTNVVAVSWPVLMVLMIGVLAPWALSRVRHA